MSQNASGSVGNGRGRVAYLPSLLAAAKAGCRAKKQIARGSHDKTNSPHGAVTAPGLAKQLPPSSSVAARAALLLSPTAKGGESLRKTQCLDSAGPRSRTPQASSLSRLDAF